MPRYCPTAKTQACSTPGTSTRITQLRFVVVGRADCDVLVGIGVFELDGTVFSGTLDAEAVLLVSVGASGAGSVIFGGAPVEVDELGLAVVVVNELGGLGAVGLVGGGAARGGVGSASGRRTSTAASAVEAAASVTPAVVAGRSRIQRPSQATPPPSAAITATRRR
jgi:hypothetical protein